MNAEHPHHDALDERIRVLTRRVVGAAPAAPDLEPLLLERDGGRRGAADRGRRAGLLLAAAIVVVVAFTAGALWRRAQAPVPVATAGGPSVALRGERDAGGDVVGLVAGAAGERVTISHRTTSLAPADLLCFVTPTSSPVCVNAPSAKVSLGLLNPGQADAVLVVVVPEAAEQVSITVKGATVWQRPYAGLVAVPVADLPEGTRLDAESAIEVEAFDGAGRSLARQQLN